LFGLYRRYWAYASIRELVTIGIATVTASVVVVLVVMLVIVSGGLPNFPRSVLGIDWRLSLFSVGGLRLAVRILAESGQISQKSDGVAGMRRVVVVGAGDAVTANLAAALHDAGRLEEALAQYQAALALRPADTALRQGRQRVEEELARRRKKAGRWCRRKSPPPSIAWKSCRCHPVRLRRCR
jgi:tetratricopeptide (TPR) repeat protein